MRRKYGTILLESDEIIFRIYLTDTMSWKLIRYHSAALRQRPATVTTYTEIIAEFFTSDTAQHIETWKVCARQLPPPFISELERATGLKIELLSYLREQEILCKGMFSELW